MTRPDVRPARERARSLDPYLRPLLVVTLIAVTAVQLPGRMAVPSLTIAVFVLVALAALGSLVSWARLPQPVQVAFAAGYVLLAVVLLPLAPDTAAPAFAFLATGAAGYLLASTRAAIGVAVLGSLAGVAAVEVTDVIGPHLLGWSWWLGLAVGAPVYIGIARRERRGALASAELAAREAERAAESEARAAALEERARIAREIHDVLGHSLSGIALQLDMADALRHEGRDEEADVATRRARGMAVGSIAETRRAIHALRADTLPLAETLRLMAAGEGASFEVVGDPRPVEVDTAQTVVRVAQEALTNAGRYAPGAERTIRLEYATATVSLTVANGPAPSPRGAAPAAGSGMGLVGMRERAALLRGTLRAGPGPGAGWTVGLEIPS
ncbi:sensor histidine kinase [Pseudonocardia xinjiangensis]|uniref:sensor histidine kinase n=1 Tax=Pseudonocardia xinjiangensis TaxID=75289 RepID=UPI003D913BC5